MGRAGVDGEATEPEDGAPSRCQLRSLSGVAAVDRECDAEHEACAWAAQPEDGGGDLVGDAERLVPCGGQLVGRGVQRALVGVGEHDGGAPEDVTDLLAGPLARAA
jgi:hypothetical protein